MSIYVGLGVIFFFVMKYFVRNSKHHQLIGFQEIAMAIAWPLMIFFIIHDIFDEKKMAKERDLSASFLSAFLICSGLYLLLVLIV